MTDPRVQATREWLMHLFGADVALGIGPAADKVLTDYWDILARELLHRIDHPPKPVEPEPTPADLGYVTFPLPVLR